MDYRFIVFLKLQHGNASVSCSVLEAPSQHCGPFSAGAPHPLRLFVQFLSRLSPVWLVMEACCLRLWLRYLRPHKSAFPMETREMRSASFGRLYLLAACLQKLTNAF